MADTIISSISGITGITVDLRSRTPIYEQIINSVKELALAGIFKPDEQIPPIRQLTQQLGINPNTIQKAYAELERQGVIYTLAGRGAFISGDTEKLADTKRKEILNEIKNSVSEAKKYFIPIETIEKIVNETYNDKNNQKELI
jgi:GntR family transcriptional regulator